LTSAGRKHLSCSAIELDPKAPRHGDEETLFFTVNASNTVVGEFPVGLVTAADELTGDEDVVIAPADFPAGAMQGDELPSPVVEGDDPNLVTLRRCYYGRWLFYDRGTYKPPAAHTTTASRAKFVLKPLPFVTVRLYANTGAYVGQGFTNENGYWRICKSYPWPSSVRAKAYTISNWKAVTTDGSPYISKAYNMYTSYRTGPNVGTWYLPYTSSNMLAYWSYNDLNRATYYFYDPIRGYTSAPGEASAPSGVYTVGPFYGGGRVKLMWTPSSTHGTHYHLSSNQIHLKANDPRTPDAAIHEYGHFLMDKLYGDTYWPSGYGGCPSPHYYNGVSNRDCAWSEGFANAVDLIVKDEKYYRWSSGSTANNETRAGFASGDRVEGNVAATFWDWLDEANDGSGTNRDYVQYKIDRFLQTVDVFNTPTFAHFFAKWKAFGDWCTPVSRALKHNINTLNKNYSCP
jgi:hypothetical protein